MYEELLRNPNFKEKQPIFLFETTNLKQKLWFWSPIPYILVTKTTNIVMQKVWFCPDSHKY